MTKTIKVAEMLQQAKDLVNLELMQRLCLQCIRSSNTSCILALDLLPSMIAYIEYLESNQKEEIKN